MKYVGEINYLAWLAGLIAIAIATGVVHVLLRTQDMLKEAHGIIALRDETIAYQDGVIVQYQAEKADALDALTDCQDKYKALERQTVEVEAVKPATKRNSKGQFAKKVESDG